MRHKFLSLPTCSASEHFFNSAISFGYGFRDLSMLMVGGCGARLRGPVRVLSRRPFRASLAPAAMAGSARTRSIHAAVSEMGSLGTFSDLCVRSPVTWVVGLPCPRSRRLLAAATRAASLSPSTQILLSVSSAAGVNTCAASCKATDTLFGVPFLRPPVFGEPLALAILFQSILDCGLPDRTPSLGWLHALSLQAAQKRPTRPFRGTGMALARSPSKGLGQPCGTRKRSLSG